MNEESLSALLDGECSAAELDQVLQQMSQHAGLRERFGRLALAQQIRWGSRVTVVPPDFADRVLAALPERPDPVGEAPRRPLPWRPLAGLAMAAALGAVAVLALKPGPADEAVVAPAPVPVAVAPADDRGVAELDDEDARQLRNYLMAYSQSRAQQGMGGTLGYARYAAYTDDRTPEGSP